MLGQNSNKLTLLLLLLVCLACSSSVSKRTAAADGSESDSTASGIPSTLSGEGVPGHQRGEAPVVVNGMNLTKFGKPVVKVTFVTREAKLYYRVTAYLVNSSGDLLAEVGPGIKAEFTPLTAAAIASSGQLSSESGKPVIASWWEIQADRSDPTAKLFVVKQTVTDIDGNSVSKQGQGSSPFLSSLFVTSKAYLGHDLRGDEATGLIGADKKCLALATDGPLTRDIKIPGTKWIAFLADSTTDGRARFPQSDSWQVINVGGQSVKDSGKKFFGDSWPSGGIGSGDGVLATSMSKLFLNEAGQEIILSSPYSDFWTGIIPNGTSATSNCNNWELGSEPFGFQGSVFNRYESGERWSWWSPPGAQVYCDVQHKLVCFLSPESL